jgi:hypothetical protein
MKSFGDLPLVVLSGVTADTGFIWRPELVTEAIRQVVAAARHNLETKSSPQTVKQ